MSKPTTHVLEIIDKSGSMYPLAEDVRGGHNSYRQSLIDDSGTRYRVSTILFSDGYQPLCIAAKPQDVPELTEKNYTCGGSTALHDAIGKTIVDFETVVGELPKGDRVLLVVQTDGQENRSQEYAVETIRKMIQDREAGGRWAAIFMGAGPDTWRQAGGMGFATSVSYANTSAGVRDSYAGLTRASATFAGGGSRSAAAAASGLTIRDDKA